MNTKVQESLESIKTAEDAIIVADSAGEIVAASSQAEALFGYGPGELDGESIDVLMSERYKRQYDEQQSRPLVAGLRFKGLRKDGRVFDARVALTSVEAGGQSYVASTVMDVSGDDTSEAYFRNVLESAPDAMVIIDHLGKIAVVNEQAEKMFGYSRAEMLGQEIEMLTPEEVRHRHISHRAAFAANPTLRPMGSNLELRGQRKDGSVFPVEISLSPFTSASGAFIHRGDSIVGIG